jgi:hypothetical protein
MAAAFVGAAGCVLAASWLLSGPRCFPGNDWPGSFSQARALLNTRQQMPCGWEGGRCQFTIETDSTGQIEVLARRVSGDGSDGQCVSVPDDQRRYYYLPNGAPDRSASSPSL